MTFEFKPLEGLDSSVCVPFIEEAQRFSAPYYASTKSVERAKSDVLDNLAVLNATGYFQEGNFVINKQQRRGFVLWFTTLNGQHGRIMVAGLPIQRPTPAKIEQVKVQALLNLADWLKGAITAQVFSPDANPLIPFMLVDETHTVAERMAGATGFALPAPKQPQPQIEVIIP